VEQPNTYLTGLTGEYLVCAEICQHNFLALTTPKKQSDVRCDFDEYDWQQVCFYSSENKIFQKYPGMEDGKCQKK